MQQASLTPNPRKRLLIIACAVVAGLAGAVAIAAVLVIWRANSEYMAALGAYRSQTHTSLTSDARRFEALKTEPTLTKSEEALVSLSDHLDEYKKQLPRVAAPFGLALPGLSDNSEVSALESKLDSFKSSVLELRHFLAYKKIVLATLSPLTAQNGNTLDEQKALAAVWQQGVTAAKNIQPPQPAMDAHVALVAALESVAASIGQLPTLYEKRDTTGFSAKQEEITSKLNGFRELHEGFVRHSQVLDTNLAREYKALLNELTNKK